MPEFSDATQQKLNLVPQTNNSRRLVYSGATPTALSLVARRGEDLRDRRTGDKVSHSKRGPVKKCKMQISRRATKPTDYRSSTYTEQCRCSITLLVISIIILLMIRWHHSKQTFDQPCTPEAVSGWTLDVPRPKERLLRAHSLPETRGSDGIVPSRAAPLMFRRAPWHGGDMRT